jgi:hypothetical protein
MRQTCAVSWGSQISNRRKSAHSVPLILWRWSAFLAENVCTVIPGQSLCKSKSSNRRFVTNTLTSCETAEFSDGALLLVLTDKLREWPWLVFEVAVDECEVDRDMLLPIVHTCASFSGFNRYHVQLAVCIGEPWCCLCAKADASANSAARWLAVCTIMFPVLFTNSFGSLRRH